MYQVYCDDNLIYDPRIDALKIINPKLDLELNKTGSFEFEIYPSNPNYSTLQKLKSIIKVYNGSELVFRGRILNDEEGFYNQKQVSCEGELAFLLDSIQRPYSHQGSPSELFTKLIETHNSQVDDAKKFKVGNITVTDPNDYISRADTTYMNTWDSINEKLINTLGGYLNVRHESDGNYIDYLADFDVFNPQKIEFGKNLLDLNKITKGEDIATAIIPLGQKDEETGEYVTIKSVNNNVDYVYNQEAVNKYGWIFKTVEWEDVTLPSNLLRKANEYLASSINLLVSIELDAFDLAAINADINSFKIGTYIKVSTLPHSIDANLLVRKLSISLDSAKSNKLTLGATYATFSEQVSSNSKQQSNVISSVSSDLGSANVAIQNVSNEVSSQISQNTNEILSTVNNDFYLKNEIDGLIESTNTKVSQVKDEFEFQFDQFSKNIEDVATDADTQFAELRKHIRFIDGNIILGEAGNELIVKIQNNRISFLQNGAEVAYFANRKMYVTDAKFLTSLTIGNFAFSSRPNGNLSFKVVT